MSTRLVATITIAPAMLLLAACGGGGSGGTAQRPAAALPPPSMTEPEVPSEVTRLLFPLRATTNRHYDVAGLPAPRAADAQHTPIYHDGNRQFVGVDQGTAHVGVLPIISEQDEIEVRYGRLDDGAGDNIVAAYLDAVADVGWSVTPTVRFGGNPTSDDIDRLMRAVQLVNTALPTTRKMEIVSDTATSDPGRGIYIDFMAETDFPITDAWGNTRLSISGPQIVHAGIMINEAYTSNGNRQATILLAHELIHALGAWSHVPSALDTIMELTTAIYATAQDGEQPVSLLYPADREFLRVLYSSRYNPDDPRAFGPWATSSLHIHGNGPHAGFGVALRNGYAEPWAYGYLPGSDLADNSSLSGSATWTGVLLGLTPRAASVAGDATISVNLGTLAGAAEFTDLETWTGAPGDPGTGARWLDGDLAYAIAVRGNTFRETGGDEGRLTGIFVGRSHEGATGTLVRSDLTAAFGAAR